MVKINFFKSSKTLQELLGTRRTLIQLGKKRYYILKRNLPQKQASNLQKRLKILIPIFKSSKDNTADLAISVFPSYMFVNDELEVWNDSGFQFKMEPNGMLSFQSGNNLNQDMLDFLEQQNISQIQIQNNLIWIWRNGKAEKRYYYAMNKRVIKDAITHKSIGFISEIPNPEDLPIKPF